MRIDDGLYLVLSPYAWHSQVIRGRCCIVVVWQLDLQLLMQSVPIT